MRPGSQVAFQDLQIGAADRGLDQPHDGIGGGGDLRLWAVLQRLLPRTIANKRFDRTTFQV